MQNYDYSRLHSSLVGVIQEAQAKIGYDRHAITFYYPAASLAHTLRNERGRGHGRAGAPRLCRFRAADARRGRGRAR